MTSLFVADHKFERGKEKGLGDKGLLMYVFRSVYNETQNLAAIWTAVVHT